MQEGSRWTGTFSALKQVGDLIRQYAIIILIAVVAFYPGAIKGWFKSSGFDKISMFGFELTQEDAERIEETEQAVNESRQIIEQLEKQLQSSQEALNQARQVIADQQVKQSIDREIISTRETLAMSDAGSQQLEKTSREIMPLASLARGYAATKRSEWGIVFGGDTTMRAAQDEIRRAVRAGFKEVKLYKQRDFYRSVILMDSRDEAERNLGIVKTSIRDSAYLVDLVQWCKSPKTENGFIACG